MNSLIRVTSAVNRVVPANPPVCCENIIDILASLRSQSSDIIIFPTLALCSPSCGNLFGNIGLLDLCKTELENLCVTTGDMDAYIIVGLALDNGGAAQSVCAVLRSGEILGFIPDLDNRHNFLPGLESGHLLPADTVFSCGNLRFCVIPCRPDELALNISAAVQTGCDLIIVPSYAPVTAGYTGETLETVRVISKSYGCAVAICNGGLGDTSSPYVYSGFASIYECGKNLGTKLSSFDNIIVTADIDTDIISSLKKLKHYKKPDFSYPAYMNQKGLLRPVGKNPYLPEDPHAQNEYVSELFELQVKSLADRLQNTGIEKLVIGVSGGLDSTLALLVAAKALDTLSLPRKNLIAVTLPGFGTTDRTYFNALSLLEALETTGRDISIKACVLQHFEDIGHNINKKDITYENAQARERAQILFDLANSERGLVVGTGDLSESALGWSTFGGDHLAGYNVNICVTKTVVRKVVGYIAEKEIFPGISDILCDILDTPVSPELLPPGGTGETVQKTEDILGPLALHDFFLYYFVKYGFRPSKLYYYACVAFSAEFEPKFIHEKLGLFLNRLFGGQFKRSCAPDSAILTDVNLSEANFYIPSDAWPHALLNEINNIEF